MAQARVADPALDAAVAAHLASAVGTEVTALRQRERELDGQQPAQAPELAEVRQRLAALKAIATAAR